LAGPQLDDATTAVLNVLLDAWEHRAELHAWEIMPRSRRPGPSVYRALDRLEGTGAGVPAAPPDPAAGLGGR
jgi:hypothetical protein